MTEREVLEHALERDRSELRRAFAELRRSTVQQIAPRERIRQSPYAWLGAAVGIGFWWAWRNAPRP